MEKGRVLLKVLGVISIMLKYFVFQIYYLQLNKKKQTS